MVVRHLEAKRLPSRYACQPSGLERFFCSSPPQHAVKELESVRQFATLAPGFA
jgi:hypothetical protein